jgi:outer membrane biosynthesis protein TonB
MYISIDAEGHVREAWPLNSDNAGLDDTARDQVKNWKIVPVKVSAGNPVQGDGPLGFRFETVK